MAADLYMRRAIGRCLLSSHFIEFVMNHCSSTRRILRQWFILALMISRLDFCDDDKNDDAFLNSSPLSADFLLSVWDRGMTRDWVSCWFRRNRVPWKAAASLLIRPMRLPMLNCTLNDADCSSSPDSMTAGVFMAVVFAAKTFCRSVHVEWARSQRWRRMYLRPQIGSYDLLSCS